MNAITEDRRLLWLKLKKQGVKVFYTRNGFLARLKDGMGYLVATNHGRNRVAVIKNNCSLI